MPGEYFEARERALLGTRYDVLYTAPCAVRRGVTVNGLRCAPQEFAAAVDFGLEPSPFCDAAFLLTDPQLRPGRHAYHHAGVFYVLEPSASVPAGLLGVRPGERVLDLCAAPGGKTSQLAAALRGEGLLVANEYVVARAGVLKSNLERMGVTNALVLNESTARVAAASPAFFDKILVDAPCSGEGMFRKNEEACGEWSPENVRLCADRQDEILDRADEMLRPGGRLVYSTCTFAPAENEGSIARFLARHRDYRILEVHKHDGMSDGVPAWAYYEDKTPGGVDTAVRERCDSGDTEALKRTIRLFPHLVRGEGHYLAVLQKQGEVPDGFRGLAANGLQKGISAKEVKEYLQFQQETLNIDLTADAQDCLLRFGEQLYRMPKDMPSIKGLRVLRAGLHLGTLRKNRFEPSQPLALALKADDFPSRLSLSPQDERIGRYLKGETLLIEKGECTRDKGWQLVCVDDFPLGFGKLVNGTLKNKYPAGWRIH